MKIETGMFGPVTFEMKVHVINENGDTGYTACTLARGQLPAVEEIHRLIGESLAATNGGESPFRLMEGEEFFNRVIVKELTGRKGNFAIGRDDEYDTTALAAVSTAAYQAIWSRRKMKPQTAAKRKQKSTRTKKTNGMTCDDY